MAEVVKLKLVSNNPVPSAKEQLLERFDVHTKNMREWLENTEAGGFALLAYDVVTEEDRPAVHSWVNTFCHNPADGFWLPDMVKVRVYQRIHE